MSFSSQSRRGRMAATPTGVLNVPNASGVFHCMVADDAVIADSAVVKYSWIAHGCHIGEGCFVTNCNIAEDTSLPSNTFAQTALLRSKSLGEVYTTALYDSTSDDLQGDTFFGVPLFPDFCELVGLVASDLWKVGEDRTLWNARVFPLADSAQTSFLSSLEIARIVMATDESTGLSLQTVPRVSLAETAARAHVFAEHARRGWLHRAIEASEDSDELVRLLTEPGNNESVDEILYRALMRKNRCADIFAALDRVASTASVGAAGRAFALTARMIGMWRSSVASGHPTRPVEPKKTGPWQTALNTLTNAAAMKSLRARGVQTMAALRDAATAVAVMSDATTIIATGDDYDHAYGQIKTLGQSLRAKAAAMATQQHCLALPEAMQMSMERRSIAGMAASYDEADEEADPMAVAEYCYATLADALMATACSTAFSLGAERAPATQPDMGVWLRVETPSRIDLAGGWTDSPPMCYESGGAVVNLAIRIDGKRQVGCRVKRVPELTLTFSRRNTMPPLDDSPDQAGDIHSTAVCSTLQDMRDYWNPRAVCALLKSAAICCDIIDVGVNAPPLAQQLAEGLGCGLVLESWAQVPVGSGLGTSSTLGGALVTGLAWAAGQGRHTAKSMTHGVIELEVISGDDAGFQDHAGGCLPGAKLLTTSASLPYRVECDCLPMDQSWADMISGHLILIFTGRSHHMPDITTVVNNRWHARVPEMVQGVHDLLKNAKNQHKALAMRDMKAFGQQVNEYWRLKKVMDPNCEPVETTALMGALRKEKLISGTSLMGGGGGGFMLAITKEPHMMEACKAAIRKHVPAEFLPGLIFHTAIADHIGMVAGCTGIGEPLRQVYNRAELDVMKQASSRL